jgi:hypothetical protein
MTGHARRMLTAAAVIAAAWCGIAYAVARVAGRALHIADVRDRQRALEPLVAQLDVPLWRGTDLHPSCGHPNHGQPDHDCRPFEPPRLPRTCAACVDGDHDDCMVRSPSFYCPCPHDLPDPARPGDGDGWAGGALLHLAHAADETTARYWLAMYARRGATWEQQRDAWDQWQQQHRSNVHHLDATPPEDQP